MIWLKTFKSCRYIYTMKYDTALMDMTLFELDCSLPSKVICEHPDLFDLKKGELENLHIVDVIIGIKKIY